MRVHQDVQELRGATVFAGSYFSTLHAQGVAGSSPVAPTNWFYANRLRGPLFAGERPAHRGGFFRYDSEIRARGRIWLTPPLSPLLQRAFADAVSS